VRQNGKYAADQHVHPYRHRRDAANENHQQEAARAQQDLERMVAFRRCEVDLDVVVVNDMKSPKDRDRMYQPVFSVLPDVEQ
jgi:hypothetical protein